jgi:hypothetical protein
MSEAETDVNRRAVLIAGAGLVVAGAAGASQPEAQPVPQPAPSPAGKPGDFNFLAGEWKIKHRRLKAAHGTEWDEFEGEATCWTILGGVGSVEELRIPSRNFAGMGLRLLDVEKKLWNDFWVNAKSGVLTTPGQTGAFENGVGTFTADDKDGDKPIKVKGVWDRITPASCRWWQAVSWDDGKTWEENWFMDWARVEPPTQGR